MKKLICFSIAALFFSAGVFANSGNDDNNKVKPSVTTEQQTPAPESADVCPPPVTTSVTVTLGPEDCAAMDLCEIEIIVTNPNDCSQDSPIVAAQDYVYGQANVFLLNFPNSMYRICAVLKPKTTCDHTFYPKCVCIPNNGQDQKINLDVCVP